MSYVIRRITFNMKHVRNIHKNNVDYLKGNTKPIKPKSKENPQTILKEVPNYLISDNDVIFVSISDEKDKKDKYMEFNTYN